MRFGVIKIAIWYCYLLWNKYSDKEHEVDICVDIDSSAGFMYLFQWWDKGQKGYICLKFWIEVGQEIEDLGCFGSSTMSIKTCNTCLDQSSNSYSEEAN